MPGFERLDQLVGKLGIVTDDKHRQSREIERPRQKRLVYREGQFGGERYAAVRDGIYDEAPAHQLNDTLDYGEAKSRPSVIGWVIGGMQLIAGDARADRDPQDHGLGAEIRRAEIDPHLGFAGLAQRVRRETNQDLTELMWPAKELVRKQRVDAQVEQRFTLGRSGTQRRHSAVRQPVKIEGAGFRAE